jgi:hypothetical protein
MQLNQPYFSNIYGHPFGDGTDRVELAASENAPLRDKNSSPWFVSLIQIKESSSDSLS